MVTTQAQLDASRRTFAVTFPSDLQEHQVTSWFNAIAGAMHSGFSRLIALPTIVFETLATDTGIEHRLRIPSKDAGFVISHLESIIPGTHVEEIKTPLRLKWTHAVELHMSNPSRQLRIPDRNVFSTSVLTSLQDLRVDEAVLIQWVIGEAHHQRPPIKEAEPQTNEFSVLKALVGSSKANTDEIDDRRKKLETANVLGVGRVAVVAPHTIRAKELARGVLKAYAAASTRANYFIERPLAPGKISRVNLATTPRMLRCQLNMAELVVINWPTGAPFVAGLPQSRTRHMHVSNAVSSGGDGATVIGKSNVSDNGRDIAIELTQRLQHTHIIGPTNSGKTSLATYMAEQDMRNGVGLVLIETKGDLYRAVLEHVPPNRIDELIVWDLDDTDYPVGFNVLRQSTSRSAVDELNALIMALYPDSGLMTTGPLYHGVHALAASELGTFIDLPTMLMPTTPEEKAWREALVAGLKNREVKRYWERYFANKQDKQEQDAAPLQRRMWEFVSRPEIRNSLGQSESSFYMEDVVREGKILLVNLNSVRIGKKTASLIGTLIMNSVWNAVRTTPHEKPVILYMDEFQNFVTMPTSPDEMLTQSRAFGLGLVLAHQHTGQLKAELNDAVMANARSKIIFQTSVKDARILASELGSHVRPEDLQNLQHREAIARVATPTGVSPAFTMRTKDLGPPISRPREIIAMSRARYGRPVEQVEAAIDARRNPSTDKSKRPPSGSPEGREWKKDD